MTTFELSASATVKVGSTTHVSGTTANDFTSPVIYTVTAEDGSTQDWVVTVTVAIGPLDHFTITGYPATTTARENFGSNNIVITAYDGNNKVKIDYIGQVYFTSTDTAAMLPYTSGSKYTFTAGDNGIHTFPGTGFTLKTAGSKTITLTDGTVSVASSGITVNPADADYFKVTGTVSMTAGGENAITIIAYDQYNNVAAGYSGDKTLTFSGASSSADPVTSPTCSNKNSTDINFASDTVITFTDGVGTSTMKLYKAETAQIKATEGTILTSDSNDLDVTVSVGSLSYVKVEDTAGGTGSEVTTHSMTADETFTVYAAGYDAYGNYKNDESVTWTGTDVCNGKLSPTSGTSTTFTPTTAGTGTITAVHATVTDDTTGIITVTGGTAKTFTVTTEHSSTETAGTAFSVTVTAKDADGNTATGYTGAYSISWTWTATNSPDNTSPAKPADGNQTFTNGAVTVTGFTLTNSGETPAITATADSVSGTTSAITISAATKSKLLWVTQPASSVAVGATWDTFTIEITDAYGNRTSDTDNVTIAPSSLTVGGTTTKAAANGLATFGDITRSTAGTITISGSASGLTSTPASSSIIVVPHTVTFDSQGGSAVASQEVAHGGKAMEPTSPTKTGYTFGGWYKEAGCTDDWVFATDTVTSDVTLYAKWTINSYIVTYDGNGNTGGTAPTDASSYEYGATVTVLTNSGNLEKTGYTFDGWDTKADGSGTDRAVGSTFNMGAANVTLYAKWVADYALRDTGSAGGLIFYVKEGGYSDGWMYLEAAPASTEWTVIYWGSSGTFISETKQGIGTGQSNTDIIVYWLDNNSEADRAAQICDALTEGSYNDWFLPSKDELGLMYTNLKDKGVGGFVGFYWSSSEINADGAWGQNFNDGNKYSGSKTGYGGVRAVRAF